MTERWNALYNDWQSSERPGSPSPDPDLSASRKRSGSPLAGPFSKRKRGEGQQEQEKGEQERKRDREQEFGLGEANEAQSHVMESLPQTASGGSNSTPSNDLVDPVLDVDNNPLDAGTNLRSP